MKNINWSLTTGFLSIFTGLLVAYNTYLVNKFDKELSMTESERALNFRIYESVGEALESENEKRILAVKVIVNAMASEELKPGFLEILKTGEAKAFAKEEAKRYVPVVFKQGDYGKKSNWKAWNFDLFWCENSGINGERLSTEIKHLFEKNGFSGRIRVRYLPESVIQREDFGKPDNFEIRVDAGEEYDNAKNILELINKSSSMSNNFNIFKIDNKEEKIPSYVSLFFCP